jgi:Derlin-2/3
VPGRLFPTTLHDAVQLITPFNIYYNSRLIVQQRELWRLVTNFFYFGSIGASARLFGGL